MNDGEMHMLNHVKYSQLTYFDHEKIKYYNHWKEP